MSGDEMRELTGISSLGIPETYSFHCRSVVAADLLENASVGLIRVARDRREAIRNYTLADA